MRVNEERLEKIATGDWGAPALTSSNPVVLEALDELGRFSGAPAEARRAGLVLAKALGLDRSDSPRVRLAVGSRMVEEAATLPSGSVRQRLGDLACRDAGLSVMCGALVGSRLDGSTRGDVDRDAVERALYLVTRMVETQEEVEALEERVAEGVMR